jgi:hypothetical protein
MGRGYRQRRRAAGDDRAAEEAAAPVRPIRGEQLVGDGRGKPEPGGQRGEQQARGLRAAALGGDDLRELMQKFIEVKLRVGPDAGDTRREVLAASRGAGPVAHRPYDADGRSPWRSPCTFGPAMAGPNVHGDGY